MKPFWIQTSGAQLAQGDFLPGCHVPAFGEDFGIEGREVEVAIKEIDLIVVTQSCDLENGKMALVALCPIHTLDTFEQTNPKFKKQGPLGNGSERPAARPPPAGISQNP